MSATTNSPLDIAIIGGGIAGLALAIGLIKHNVPVVIYEGAHHFGEIGAGVSLGPSAIRAMKGIDPRVKEGFDRVATFNGDEDLKNVYFDWRYGEGEKSGETFFRQYCDYPEHYGGVHRARYLEELIKLVPEGVAHFGKRIDDVQDAEDGRIRLHFKDGSVATHGCVIGCDGIHSVVRKYILGADDPASYAVFSGKYVHRGLAPMEEAKKVLGENMAMNSQFYLGHHAHLLTFPVDHGRIMNAVAFGSCEKWDNDKWVVHGDFKDINQDFAAFGEPVQKIIGMMRNTDIWALFNHLPTRTYHKGNAVIIGDAAHATTPHQGSGAGMAIEDGYVLSSLLSHVKKLEDVSACFQAYDAVRRERGNKLVKTSYEAGLLWDLEDPEAGDDLAKVADNAAKRMDWIWGEDLDAEIKEGLRLMGTV